MTDTIRMVSKTTFFNERVTVFRTNGPKEGETGVPVTIGDEFETHPLHARELAALGHAAPASGTVEDIPDAPLEPHHQVSETDLRADRQRRASKADKAATA